MSRLGLLLVTLLVLAAGCSGRTTSSRPPSSSDILYSCGNRQVCAVHPDGSGARQLPLPTPGPQGSSDEALGTCAVSLVGDRAACPEAAFSEDYGPEYRDLQLLVGSADGQGLRGVWTPPSGAFVGVGGRNAADFTLPPAWNAAGSEVALAVPDATLAPAEAPELYALWIIDASTGHAHRVTGADGRPLPLPPDANRLVWSPDGATLAYGTSTAVVTVPAAGGAPRTIYTVPPPPRFGFSTQESNVEPTSWSPDDHTVLAMAGHTVDRDVPLGPTQQVIYDSLEAIPASGGMPRAISLGPDAVSTAFFSPDGQHLVAQLASGDRVGPDGHLLRPISSVVGSGPTSAVMARPDGSDPIVFPSVPASAAILGWVAGSGARAWASRKTSSPSCC